LCTFMRVDVWEWVLFKVL